ncbi:MAG: UvrD-helicase domain-containing protein [Phycisphaerae bacterium]
MGNSKASSPRLAWWTLRDPAAIQGAMQRSTQATIEDLFAGLNDAQRDAVAHTDGPLLVLAGPGSGKTRVVTRRAVHLASTVTASFHILAITFTNKAAKEMQERIQALSVADGMTVCTFHALCAKLLRWYHDRAGVPRRFTIFDRDDRRKLIKQAIEESDLSTTNWAPASVDQDISRAKNAMLTAGAFAEVASDWREQTIARIYACYEQLLAKMGGLDFDDLLMRVAMLLDRDRDLRSELEDRYRYVLIDEYQDTNVAQYQMARLLTERRQNLCATGDPDQSIYGWRGADIGNILGFERDYPNAKVVRLEQNYRSTKRILSAADRLIAGNVNRKEKTLWTENDDGVSVRVVECESGDTEAEMIAQDIGRQVRAGLSANDIAVFYRINSLSRVIEEAFLKEGLAYQIARGVEFYSRKEIKDVLAYLRVLVNPADEVSLLRIINTPPRGIGATTIRRLTEQAHTAGRSIHDLLTSGDDLSSLGRSAGKVHAFVELLSGLKPALEQPAPEAMEFVISRSGLRALYGAASDADAAPIDNINELISAAAEYQVDHPDATVLDWLEHTALLSDIDVVRGESGAVTLMTLHAAKGLEFSVAYIVGLEEGMLPFRRHEWADFDEEEERRLLFVGMTRARKRLTLSHARYRMLRGVTERTVRSPFLDELPDDQIKWDEVGIDPPRHRRTGDEGDLPDDIDQWAVGTLVRHPAYGLGQIISMHRGARRTQVEVQFQDGPRRSWVLEFAKLERVDFDEVGDTGGP